MSRPAWSAARSVYRAARRALGRPVRPGPLQLAYVALLDDAAHNYVSALQLSIQRQYGANPALEAPPHITLKLGFAAPNLASVERHFDRLLKEAGSIEVCLRGFGFFDEGIAFMDVEPNPRLEALRRRLVDELAAQHGIRPHPLEGDLFRFHVTVAYDLSGQDFARLREQLRPLTTELRFVLPALALLCRTGHHWVVYKRGDPRR